MNEDLKRMGDLVVKGLELAFRGLYERNTALSDEVTANENAIDALEVEIDREGLQVIVLYQPVASDLRKVVSAMKVSGNLERIGDEAVNIAKRTRRLNKHQELEELGLIQPAYEMASSLLKESLGSYWRGEVREAMGVKDEDKNLDRVCKKANKILTKKLANNPGLVNELVNLMFVIRSLERVGDHAKNIAEDAIFAKAARDIRHGGEMAYGGEEE